MLRGGGGTAAAVSNPQTEPENRKEVTLATAPKRKSGWTQEKATGRK
jgi:hypothetical protein